MPSFSCQRNVLVIAHVPQQLFKTRLSTTLIGFFMQNLMFLFSFALSHALSPHLGCVFCAIFQSSVVFLRQHASQIEEVPSHHVSHSLSIAPWRCSLPTFLVRLCFDELQVCQGSLPLCLSVHWRHRFCCPTQLHSHNDQPVESVMIQGFLQKGRAGSRPPVIRMAMFILRIALVICFNRLDLTSFLFCTMEVA